ncbi:MAG: phosphoglycerate kinase, partial [Candidatus Nomurabacteria bacterium]|nr:phosphoglycerate kinase [Candidatus Nomurabacteria bacterium]
MAVGQLVFPKKTLAHAMVEGRTILLRADYNVPMSGGKITDDFRLRASLPTLNYLLRHGASVVVISHLGRPDGAIDAQYSLAPIAKNLEKLLARPVKFVPDCIGDKVKVATRRMRAGEVVLLENLRFHPGEEANDAEFARALAKDTNAKLFVQDGFGVAHRAHASTVAITDFLPSVAGLLVEREWLSVKNVVRNPNRPLVALIGGAKIADKTPLIEKMIDVADQIIIGGAIANNFLIQQGFPVGASLWKPDMDEVVNKIIVRARERYGGEFRQRFIVPVDVAVSRNGNPDGARHVLARTAVKPNNAIFDIGTKSISRAVEAIERAGTVVWNGTLGVAEKPNFAHGSSRAAL